MLDSRPTSTARRPPAAALVLQEALAGFRGDLTVADAAARGGIALQAAEEGLRHVAWHRGGRLKATESGELIYSFPAGLVWPDESRGRRLLRRAGRVFASLGRFVVRAWVSVVLIGYALVFLAVLLALAARDDDGDGVSGALAMVGRLVLEALFWTFHPFSPLALGFDPMYGGRRRAPKIPFYERVNRFVFGPPQAKEDPRERERVLVTEIRRLQGRIGPEDVTRLTGLDREQAERELLRLVVEYDGDIQVSDGGAILYVFKALRPTALPASSLSSSALAPSPQPIWDQRLSVRPLTGNGAGTNVFLTALNGFNLAVSGAAIAYGLTIERLVALVTTVTTSAAGAEAAGAAIPIPPPDGAALALGWIPFLFSAAMFALPLARVFKRRKEAARVGAENGRRAILRLVLGDPDGRAEIPAAEAERAWTAAAGAGAPKRRATRVARVEAAVRELGGDVDITDDGGVVYRFDLGARERRALAEARVAAGPTEAHPGRVVFEA